MLHSRGSVLHNLKNGNHRAQRVCTRCDLRSSARVALGEPESPLLSLRMGEGWFNTCRAHAFVVGIGVESLAPFCAQSTRVVSCGIPSTHKELFPLILARTPTILRESSHKDGKKAIQQDFAVLFGVLTATLLSALMKTSP